MLSWGKIVAGFVGIIQWFQRMFLRAELKQDGRNQRDAETLSKITEGRNARNRLLVDNEYTNKLLAEIDRREAEGDDNGQLLHELHSRMSAGKGTPEYGKGHIAKLRNVEGALFKYSRSSLRHLSTCEYKLQLIALILSKEVNATVVCGTRSMEEQRIAYESGASKVPPGRSKHNRLPSAAIDIVPAEAPHLWAKNEDLPFEDYVEFKDRLFAIAEKYGITLRWGGDWDMDGDSTDQTFMDLAHYEVSNG